MDERNEPLSTTSTLAYHRFIHIVLAQVSTTQNIYSHLIEQADTQSAERIADAIFRSGKKLG